MKLWSQRGSRMNRYCCPCIGTKRAGRLLRTLVVVSNILYWFAGCAVLSVSIWLRFVDVGTKDYYSTFHPFDTGLYVVLVASILFLVVSFVGTCAANTKNEMMLSLYIAVVFVVSLAEVISLIVFSSYFAKIEEEFLRWYENHFMKYPYEKDKLHQDIVDHVQSKLKCCGLKGPSDYFVIFSNQSIPSSCMIKTKFVEDIVRPEMHAAGCMQKLKELVTWLMSGWPIAFTSTMILAMQVTGITSGILFLQHIFYRRTYNFGDDDEEDEISGLINSRTQCDDANHQIVQDIKKNWHLDDLPRPKVFRIVKSHHESSYGFVLQFDEEKMRHIIDDIEPGSNAEYAGISLRSELIEINGMLLDGVSPEWIEEKVANAPNEVRMVLVDENTSNIYKTQKVYVNLKNVEGVTNLDCEYKPRLCTLTKRSQGFGFHLLYLEDRKGEYIEDVAQDSPAFDAGLCIGDRILDVNGINIEKELSSDVVKRIRMSGDTVSLLVVDPKTDGYYRKKGVTVTASLAMSYFDGKLSSQASTPREKRKSRRDVKPRYCRLVKSNKEDFGLYVVIDNNRIGQVIRWVDCGGPADRAGLRIGDRIIEVNGHSVEYESHQRLISCISPSRNLSHFIVVDEDYDRVYKRNKPRLCHIFKESESFGFCICYQEQKAGHYVEEVDISGPAERAGLRVNDRVIQINGLNVERESHQNVLSRLRACATEVVLLVIDSKSDRHYKKIADFKSNGMDEIEYDAISVIEEPLFLHDEGETASIKSDRTSLSFNESVSLTSTIRDVGTRNVSMKGKTTALTDHRGCRRCVVSMAKGEKQGFFLSVDRDRNGQVIKRVEKGGPADRAGLEDGDRIISINGENINQLTHDEVVDKIRASGRSFILIVIDQRSDDVSIKHKPFIYRIVKDEGGYGFYLWYDEDGHYVEDITIGSPADKAGMRSGDRVIEVNGVNVEEETHEEVFYRVKACTNIVTLLGVDLKTFQLYKKNNVPISVLKAESKFSGHSRNDADKRSTKKSRTVARDLKLHRQDGEDFGFNLAYSNSFMDESSAGAHIVHWVELGGPAHTAGLRDGDKIVAIDGNDITNEDHDKLIELLYQVGKKDVTISVQYEETHDAYVTHKVSIKKVDDSFGFYLWFDENGHYIEDVTIGSAADVAGLKIGDRVLEVNGKNIEDKVHAEVVSHVRENPNTVDLLVFSVHSEDVNDFAHPIVYAIEKEQGTFGFSISQDDKGFHFDYVAAGAPADNAGICVGDRLLEVNGEAVSDLTSSHVVSMVRASGKRVALTVISSTKNLSNVRTNGNGFHIFRELQGDESTEHQHISQERGMESGTDMSQPDDSANEYVSDAGLPDRNNERVELKIKYSTGKDNIAFVEDEENENMGIPQEELLDNGSDGRYLENKLSQAVMHATKRRRKPGKNIYGLRKYSESKLGSERRMRNLTDIERKLAGTIQRTKKAGSTLKRNASKGSASQDRSTKKERNFHLATSKSSLQEKWNFEQGDSRRPGEIDQVVVEEPETSEHDTSSEKYHELSESVSKNNEVEDDTDGPPKITEDGAEEVEIHSLDSINTADKKNVTVDSETAVEQKDEASQLDDNDADVDATPYEVQVEPPSVDDETNDKDSTKFNAEAKQGDEEPPEEIQLYPEVTEKPTGETERDKNLVNSTDVSTPEELDGLSETEIEIIL